MCRSGETPVHFTAALAHHLQTLAGDLDQGDPDRAEQIALGLTQLSTDVAGTVPSCLAVSLVLARWEADVVLGTLSRADASLTPVLASLAVPLSAFDPGELLVLQAGTPGAFLLLSDDLGGLLGPGHPPIELDAHLQLPPAVTGESLASSLADLRVINQGIGVLLEQGLSPEAAPEELQRRAHHADTTLAVASQVLLDSLPRRAHPR